MYGFIFGRLGKDAEVNDTQNGGKCVKFTVAQNEYRGGEDKTTWYDVISYDSYVANTQIKVLKKGVFVIVVGDVTSTVNIGKNNKIYQNHNIITSKIYVPSLGSGNSSKSEETAIETPSVGTLNVTPTTPTPAVQPAVVASVSSISQAINDSGDDLPF